MVSYKAAAPELLRTIANVSIALFLVLQASCALAASSVDSMANALEKPRLTVAASVEATRLLGLLYSDNPVLMSPNNKRFLVGLVQGDIARNGNWVRLISGSAESMDEASELETVATLFTTSGKDNPLRDLGRVAWLSDIEIAFLWNDGVSPTRVCTLNLETKQLRTLVNRKTDITYFDVLKKDGPIVFTTVSETSESRADEMRQSGFAVSTSSIYPLLAGHYDGREPWTAGDVFVQLSGDQPARRIDLESRRPSLWPPRPQLSATGRWIVVESPIDSFPDEWDERVGSSIRELMQQAKAYPDQASRAVQLMVVDAERQTVRPLLNVPTAAGETSSVWAPDDSSVIVGPTSSASGPASKATVVEVNLLTGRIVDVLEEDSKGIKYRPVKWHDRNTVELASTDGSGRAIVMRKFSGHWKRSETPELSPRARSVVTVKWRQDLNTPPRLFASDPASGRERMLLDVNASIISKYRLGKVEPFRWQSRDGRQWTGRLYYPVDYREGARYPLVIQSHPLSSSLSQFSLNGHEGISTVFSAQPLASVGIAVLQSAGPDVGERELAVTPEERPAYVGGYESAIDNLANRGLIDRSKVGLVGFSRSGLYVTYALTRAKFPIAAAVINDHSDSSYVQYVTSTNEVRDEYERANGGMPIGGMPISEGFKAWLDSAPGFNADKIRTPLRLERAEGMVGILQAWELFSQLRYLRRPVEMYILPDIEDSTHCLEKPLQVLASQAGTVDWMNFWLNGAEDPDIAKVEQYKRWRLLRSANGRLHQTE